MRIEKKHLFHVAFALLIFWAAHIHAQATQRLKSPTPPSKLNTISASLPKKAVSVKPSAIVGELDEMDGGDASLGPDEVRLTQSSQKMGGKVKKSARALEREKLERIKQEQEREKEKKKQEKILIGFEKAEKFHHDWFHFSPAQIKKSAENLTKFCTAACTKKQCMNLDIANNCHLMCPKSTREYCPDPLKRSISASSDEVVIGNEEKGVKDPLLQYEARLSKEGNKPDMDREG